MHGDAAGLILSVLLIGFCLGLSIFVSKTGKSRLGAMCPEIARKIVHIGVSNWFFIYFHVFESDLWPVAGLTAFALINAYMNISGLLGKLMGQESTGRNWGLVQYPVSIIMLIVLKNFGVGNMVAMGCAVLGMGYGDGLASIAGMTLKSRPITKTSKKSVAGFVTMALVTLAVFVLINLAYGPGVPVPRLLLFGLLTSIAAALTEAFTPFGLDNISVPLTIYLIAGLV